MGMAASQARFLGLTARKSNVEYQGQQINQQRTALATESSNFYHQIMSLDVPTAPVTTDYYKTVYTLDNSAIGNYSDYNIENLTKTYNGTNQYTVKLTTNEKETSATGSTFLFTKSSRNKITPQNDDGTFGTPYWSYTSTINNTYVNFDAQDQTAYRQDSNTGKNVLNIARGTIYKIDSETAKLLGDNDGYNAILKKLNNDGISITTSQEGETGVDPVERGEDESQFLYFYQDASGKNCYLTENELYKMTIGAFQADSAYSNLNDEDPDNATIATINAGTYSNIYYPIELQREISTEVNATLETSSNGRYTSITIDENENYPTSLSGKTFTITTSRTKDEDAAEEAQSDYEYMKEIYDKTIEDINSKTKLIQSEDKQLELRLQQLDTEQEAIAKEMDSVEKVMNDNIEKTFDAFG